MSHLKATHFIRSVSIITLSALLFSTVGIHFVHPFFHHHHNHHHCAGCNHFSVHSGHQDATISIVEKHAISKEQEECPICSFLLHFNLYKAASYTLLHQQECLKEFPLALKSPFARQIDFSPIRARAPPVSTI